MTAIVRAVGIAPCVAYTRVSKEDQARDDKTSLADQRNAVNALAKRLGITVAETFTDPGRSGDGIEHRPALKQLLDYCVRNPQPKNRPGYVLALNDSRWGRFTETQGEEGTYWRVHLWKHGWRVQFAEGDSGDSDARPMERAMYQLTDSQYLVRIKRNAKRGARGTYEKGYWRTEAPLGYRRCVVDGPRKGFVIPRGERKAENERVELVLGPEAEQRVVRFMFESYDSGEVSLGGLVRALKERWPNLRKWSRGVVRQILMNPSFCGDLVGMRRSNGPRDGDPVTRRNAFAALIDRGLWERVQNRLRSNRKETRATAGGYPLRGLVTCSACGAAYVGSGGARGPVTDPDRYRFYREKEQGKRCGFRQGTLQKRLVEPLVVAEVAKVVSSPAVQKLIAAELDRVLNRDTETVARKALDAERAALLTKRKRVVDAVAEGTLSAQDAKATLGELNAAIEGLAAQAEQLRFRTSSRKAIAAERDRLVSLAQDFAERARNASGAVLRELLIPWLDGITMDKEQRLLKLRIRQVPFIGLLSAQGRD